MFKNNNGFTLAEVLITLLIIGVVASLVVPNLINDAQDAELKTAWKKAYSEIEQATRLVMMDNGGTNKGLCADNDDNCLKNIFINYFSYTKACNENLTYGYCWHKQDGKWKYLDGTPVTTWSNHSGVILSNGNLILFWYRSSNCDYVDDGIPMCGAINVDINGFKNPNIMGKDIFRIHLTKDGLKPYGSPGDSWGCEGSTGAYSGIGCSAKYLYQ
jgi:prepilin-type N-terminal cleavage/methylation domain-containing protein